MRTPASILALSLLSGCGPASTTLVEEDEPGSASDNILCALGDESEFTPSCTMQRFYDGDTSRIILGREDSGYRRFIITQDGRGVKTADGAESAQVSIAAEGEVEVRVGPDRYRLPAITASKNMPPEQ